MPGNCINAYQKYEEPSETVVQAVGTFDLESGGFTFNNLNSATNGRYISYDSSVF